MRVLYLICLSLGMFLNKTTASVYLVYLKDKGACSEAYKPQDLLSEKAIARRNRQCIAINTTDLPINKQYLSSIRSTGANVLKHSKWLNLVAVEADDAQLNMIRRLHFVDHITPKKNIKTVPCRAAANRVLTELDTFTTTENQLEMIGLDKLHAKRLNGKDITITFMDGGFTNVNQLQAYRHIFNSNRIIATHNFVNPALNVYDLGGAGEHGSRVFSIAAALAPDNFFGAGYGASFILAVTEDAAGESSLEELNWAMAAEWADSIGTDIINSSVGYFTAFTSGTGYTYADMDGKTTIVTKAAQAAASKGILVVASVGNEGDKGWYYLIAPADGDSVLAAGGVDALGQYAEFSSKGPSADGRIKPDVCARAHATIQIGSNGHIIWGFGTSFSAPLISGLAACLWQADTMLSNMQLFHIIRASGHRHGNPDNLVGHGIPDAGAAYEMITGARLSVPKAETGGFIIYPNPAPAKEVHVGVDNTKGFSRMLQFEITEMSGRPVTSFFVTISGERYSEQTLDLSRNIFSGGLFIMHIRNEAGLLLGSKKMIIY